jgi:hypothetical protein
MRADAKKPVLIAVSVEKIKPEPYIGPSGGVLQSVSFRARSAVKEACFTRESGPLHPDLIPGCEKLQRHGFTVVEAPENSQWGHFAVAGGWQTVVLQQAIKQVEALANSQEQVEMRGYNEELAENVLDVVSRAFPAQLSMTELKHNLQPEPSDEALLIALEALLIDKLVEGPHIRSGYKNELRDIALVRITTEGRKHLAVKSGSSSLQGTVVHGDQINNYGNAAAIGRNSNGSINFHQEWQQIEASTDMEVLTGQLEQLRTELQRVAKTRDDYKQLGIVAEAEDLAEKREGGKVLETLSKVGKDVLKVAEKIGIDVAAKVISKSLGFEP